MSRRVVSQISENNLSEQLEIYRRTLDLNPRDIAARYELSLELERLGSYEEALAELRTILKFDSNNLPAREAILRINKKKELL